MRRAFTIIGLFLLLSLLSACRQETLPADGNGPRMLEIPFGAALSQDVLVTTKSTLGLKPESTIYNLYVYIFEENNSGVPDKKVYGKFFDANNLIDNPLLQDDHWWMTINETGTVSQGTISVKVDDLPAEKRYTIVAISNIDADMVNISPEFLGTVKDYAELSSEAARLNQAILSRSGYFPMSGELRGVARADFEAKNKTLQLHRLDAKIKFNVRALGKGDSGVESNISSFTPLKWQVVNVPKKAYILERGLLADAGQGRFYDDASLTEEDFFDSPETNFETEELPPVDQRTDPKNLYRGTDATIPTYGFSFYMMENRKSKDGNTLAAYKDREEHRKDMSGKNLGFMNAPGYSTYVVITGNLVMYNDGTTYDAGATLGAEVKYVIHLGNFGDGTNGVKLGDFNVFRNHTYTYNITIKDVDDIRVEVMTGTENETGATGRVTVSKEKVYTFDSHYCSEVLSFYARNFDEDNVSWEVKTPFNPSGARPVVVEGVDNTTGIDFEWVEFRVHTRKTNEDATHWFYQRDYREPYYPKDGTEEGAKTMNISELVKYLKGEKEKWKNGEASAFDNPTDNTAYGDSCKICVTAFINEFYYEKNPISGQPEAELWKKFVNQPMRVMYILSTTHVSPDGESIVIGASYTLRQHSIQSVYNHASPDIFSAWGSEYVADAHESVCNQYVTNAKRTEDSQAGKSKRDNIDPENGRINTVIEWEVLGEEHETKGDAAARWETFMDMDAAPGSDAVMLDKYRSLRYTCMSRNRDNDGDGYIDKSEIRWYMAASNQLIGLFLGSYGIDGAARMYNRTPAEREGNNWREHVLASNRPADADNSNTKPRIVWAEEGLNGSNMANNAGTTPDFTGRCIRNLGFAGGQDITYSDYDVLPDSLITVKRMLNGKSYSASVNTNTYNDNVYYEFDCSRVNEQSLRFYSDRELVAHDEHSEAACLYKRFRAAPANDCPTTTEANKWFIEPVNEYLDSHITENPYCPPGYRLPNIREIGVIRYFLSDSEAKKYQNTANNHFMFTRTHYSFGVAGSKKDNNAWGWGSSHQKVLMAYTSQGTVQLRCVKDIKVD